MTTYREQRPYPSFPTVRHERDRESHSAQRFHIPRSWNDDKTTERGTPTA